MTIYFNKIKLHFLKGGQGHRNTASYNRFLMLQQMAAMNFEVEIMGDTTCSKEKVRKNKWINAICFRLNILKGAWRVPTSSDDRINVIFLLSTEPIIFLFVWMIVCFKGIKIISERNEFPETIRKGIPWRIFFYKVFVLWWQYRLIDGLFLMTDELIRFYTPYTKKNCVIQKLPMTVDFSRFENLELATSEVSYLFYAGSLSQQKDGVESLVKAFAKVSKKYPGLQLWIAGGKKQIAEKKIIKNIVDSLGLNSIVKLLGELERDDMPQYLLNSKIVALPRPDSKQAQGGFPTKLGEYLASGKPVIATQVGEIPQYLNEQHAFLISPDNIEAELAEAIDEICKNYAQALDIASKGKAKAFACFSTERNAEKIKNLVSNIVINN